MITAMTKYSFIMFNAEAEGFLKRLQELGVVDITRSRKPVDAKSSAILEKATEIRKVISHKMQLKMPELTLPLRVFFPQQQRE